MSTKPLMWKVIDRNEKDDLWPKKVIGHSMVYLNDLNKYIVIGGNFDAYANMMKNIEFNSKLIQGIDNNIENFESLNQEKIKYFSEALSNNYNRPIDVLLYDSDQNRWSRISTKGKVPRARSFHQCIYIKPFIFCFGGLVLGDNGGNHSVNELYFLNIESYQWKSIISRETLYDRSDFTLNKIDDSNALLFGGASSPSDTYFDDLWLFKYEPIDVNITRQEISKDVWKRVKTNGKSPPAMRGHSAEFFEGSLYVFGGEDSKRKNLNLLFKYEIATNTWSQVITKGKPPEPRSYHNFKLINRNSMIVFSGIKGTLNSIEQIFDDYFIFNIHQLTWFSPVIGGFQPYPRFGFSFTPNYNFSKMEILILGGYTREYDMKLYILSEIDYESKKYWTIRDINYIEETNDEKFLVESDEQLQRQRDKINNLEIENYQREIEVINMKHQLEDIKKENFKKHGIIDDQAQTLDDVILDLETQRNKMKKFIAVEQEITDTKQKMKKIMQRKNHKTLEFFCHSQKLFLKMFDTVIKITENNKTCSNENELYNNYFKLNEVEQIKLEFLEKTSNLKEKLEKIESKEDRLMTDMERVKKLDRHVDELFKSEIEHFKIKDDSFQTEYNVDPGN